MPKGYFPRRRRPDDTDHPVQLALLPGQDVAVPVRFGGDASPQHSLLLRFGPMEHDGTVPGHLIATGRQGHLAARRTIVWDPVLRSFGWANRQEAERLVEELDPVSALAGMVARGVARTCEAAMTFLDGMLQPGFILIGGIGTILVGYLLYYSLWFLLAKTLLLWLFLPSLGVASACSYVHHQRMQRLRTALFQAAWHALDPATYYAPQ